MSRLVAIAGLSALLAGCGIFPPNHQGGISTTITPEDYGQRLCKHLSLEDYPTCMNQVLDYMAEPYVDVPVPSVSTSGPFVVMMNDQVYRGTYNSAPFASYFRVTSASNACKGSYNAFMGSADAIFDVYCDDGRSGWADIVMGRDGRNGIGRLALDDGTQGDIVFGYKPLGVEAGYPYKP